MPKKANSQLPIANYKKPTPKKQTRVKKTNTRTGKKKKISDIGTLSDISSQKLGIKRHAISELTVQVLNFDGKSSRTTLPAEIFGVKVKPQTLAQAVRVYLVNQRAGSAKTKTRGEVSGGGAKPWRQKGTGRARAGSIRAPHWSGGGIVFGPKEQQFVAKLPKKVKRKALAGAISARFAAGEVRVVNNFEKISPKTKELIKAFKKLNIPREKILWVVDGTAANLVRAGQNLPNLTFARVENLTTYKVLAAKILILNKNVIEKLMLRLRGSTALSGSPPKGSTSSFGQLRMKEGVS